MKKLLAITSIISMFSFSLAANLNVSKGKESVTISAKSDKDIHGLQFDVCGCNFTNISIEKLAQTDIEIYNSEMKDNGCFKVLAFSVTGQNVASANDVSKVMEINTGCTDVTIENIIMAGESGIEMTVENTVYDIMLPSQSQLIGNYPNPFNPSTTIEFDLGEFDAGLVNDFSLFQNEKFYLKITL